jgi:predicted Rossmann-fold nucleotide-binding protein
MSGTDRSSLMTIRSIKTIAVFCGSNYGASEEFADGARALGRALGKAGITIVYGGTTKGLMGVVADVALASGGNVHGVITDSLHRRGHSHSGLTKHDRADPAQPEGTYGRDCRCIHRTAGRNRDYRRVYGGMDHTAFLRFIDHMVDTKFLPAAHRHSISVDADASVLIDKLRSCARVDVPKWL